MEKRLSLSRGPFYNPSIPLIESIVTSAILNISSLLKGHITDSAFPNKETLLSNYDWLDRMQFEDTYYALDKFQTELNHALLLCGGIDILEIGNYTCVRYRNGTIFVS